MLIPASRCGAFLVALAMLLVGDHSHRAVERRSGGGVIEVRPESGR